MKKKRISNVQLILTILFTSVLLVSNIISSKIFNLFGFAMTSAVIVFPITYILSDIFSEVYGYKYSRFTCYLAFIINLLAVGIFYIVYSLPAIDPSQNEAFKQVLVGAFNCTMASFIAFVVGDFFNDKVFSLMKRKHEGLTNHKGFGFRAILSSICGELIDSFIYLPLAFLVFNPIMTINDVLIMIIVQVSIKVIYEIITMPLTLFIVKKVSSYENSLLIN